MLIKNIHLLAWLNEEALLRLEQTALAHQRFSRIEFKIASVIANEITIIVTQSKCPQENYQTQKRLIEIVQEAFKAYIESRRILVQATPYIPSPVEVVTPEWITQQMSRYKIALKQLAIDTGINKSSLSSVITGDKPLSDPMRAMFYYYFKTIA